MIRYSIIKAARFVTHGEDGKDTLGPVVIWIATHPGTTTAQNAYNASPHILAVLKANECYGPQALYTSPANPYVISLNPLPHDSSCTHTFVLS